MKKIRPTKKSKAKKTSSEKVTKKSAKPKGKALEGKASLAALFGEVKKLNSAKLFESNLAAYATLL